MHEGRKMGEFAPDLGVQLALEIVISIEIQRVDMEKRFEVKSL